MKVFYPLRTIEDVLDYWWLMAALIVWGGAAGWYIHTTRPPVYEAQAVFFLSIDFTQTGELTQFEQDQAAWGAAGVAVSDPVVDRVAALAREQGIATDPLSLRTAAHFERKQARWILRVRDPDPQTAAALANLWAVEGLAALTSAHQSALEAEALRGRLASLQGCLEGAGAGSETPCGATTEAINAAIQATSAAAVQAQAASQGMLPAMVIGQPEGAGVPREPAQYGRNSLVFAGGMIGFLIGIVVVYLRLPERLAQGLHRG